MNSGAVLWADAFVEEANLSQNIFVLRKALGDTPEAKRYIVTLPGTKLLPSAIRRSCELRGSTAIRPSGAA